MGRHATAPRDLDDAGSTTARLAARARGDVRLFRDSVGRRAALAVAIPVEPT